jgi:hypothetical protein
MTCNRVYQDFALGYAIDQAGAIFVIPAKERMDAGRVYSMLVDRSTGVTFSQRVIQGADARASRG